MSDMRGHEAELNAAAENRGTESCNVADGMAVVKGWVAAQTGMWVVLIDGRSGAGKTTFATALSATLNADRARGTASALLVHLEDFYPGWGGLSAARRMVAEDVLHPVKPGYRTWDWVNNTPDEWVDLPPGHPLIIEGVGALSSETLEHLAARAIPVLSVVIDAPTELRKRRALHRDPDYAPWWHMWAEQEREHLHVRPAADVRVRSSSPA